MRGFRSMLRGGRRELGEDGPATLLSWDAAPGTRHRLQIHDDTVGRWAVDAEVVGDSFLVPWSALTDGHDHRWRAVPADGNGGDPPFRPLPPELVLRDERAADSPVAPGMLLVLSIDTEAFLTRMRHPDPRRAVDELIFGDFGGGEDLGIGLHMDLLEHFGFRGCFFVDVLLEYEYGPEALERVVEAILARGHEIQLHIHPEHLAFARSDEERCLARALWSGQPDEFKRVLALAADLFERRVGVRPRAYRSGSYHLQDEFLDALADEGIAIDSSMNPWHYCRVSEWMTGRTQPFRVGDVLEVPPAWSVRDAGNGDRSTRAFAPNPTSGEPLSMLGAPGRDEPLVATFVSHSFALSAGDRTTDAGELERWMAELRAADLDGLYAQTPAPALETFFFHEPRADAESLANLCATLRRVSLRDDATCVTFAELADMSTGWWQGPVSSGIEPIPVWHSRAHVADVTASRVYDGTLRDRVREPRNEAAALEEALERIPSEWQARADSNTLREPLSDCAPDELQRLLADARARLGPEDVVAARAAIRVPVFPAFVAGRDTGPAWDAATWVEVLRLSGLEAVWVERRPRSTEDRSALEAHAQKLRGFDPDELATGSIELLLRAAEPVEMKAAAEPAALGDDLRRRTEPVVAHRRVATTLADSPEAVDVAIVDGQLQTLSPWELSAVVDRLYDGLAPGGDLHFAHDSARGGWLTATSCLACCLDAGFETVSVDRDGTRLFARMVKPYGLRELADLRAQR
jgi:hypothetical protein